MDYVKNIYLYFTEMRRKKILDFIQNDNMLSVNATGFPYGMSTCVRVAKAKIK